MGAGCPPSLAAHEELVNGRGWGEGVGGEGESGVGGSGPSHPLSLPRGAGSAFRCVCFFLNPATPGSCRGSRLLPPPPGGCHTTDIFSDDSWPGERGSSTERLLKRARAKPATLNSSGGERRSVAGAWPGLQLRLRRCGEARAAGTPALRGPSSTSDPGRNCGPERAMSHLRPLRDHT